MASETESSYRAYYDLRTILSIDQGILLRDKTRVVVPAGLRRKKINLGHEGHPSFERSKRRLKELYWWPRM
ncbi:MAG: hypothetical protein GY696_00890 [Gammaproteobacteria bacterium]|nr:hypothetical protein [Gammaproteobacteria bacterium]